MSSRCLCSCHICKLVVLHLPKQKTLIYMCFWFFLLFFFCYLFVFCLFVFAVVALPCLLPTVTMPAQKDRWFPSFSFLLFCAYFIAMLGSTSLLQELSPQEYFGGLQAGRASLAYFSPNGMYSTACTSAGFAGDSCQGVYGSGITRRQF